MIKNARVFQEEFVPDDLVHRHSEAEQLSTALQPVLHDQPPTDAFLFGPTGVGKTCTARYILDELREQVLDVNTRYINCWDRNEHDVLKHVPGGIEQRMDVNYQSKSKGQLVDRLQEAVEDPLHCDPRRG